MKSILVSTIAAILLAASSAHAADGLIYISDEAGAADNAITLEDNFTGGVAGSDAHDGGGGGLVIQMLMPNSSASSVTGAAGPFVSRPAITSASR